MITNKASAETTTSTSNDGGVLTDNHLRQVRLPREELALATIPEGGPRANRVIGPATLSPAV